MMPVIRNPDDLTRALSCGELQLTTPSGAVGYLGALYIKEMIVAAQDEFPDTNFILWADCGGDAGLVMGALRTGLKHLTVQAAGETMAKLQEMAAQCGAHIKTA